MQRGWDLINPGVKDPVARLTEQDQDGVVGEVMYPSINMLTYMVDDTEVVNAVFQRHNDWIRDYCSHAPERLIGVGCLTLRDVETGIAELERCAKHGHQGTRDPLHRAQGPAVLGLLLRALLDRRRRGRPAADDAHLLRGRTGHGPAEGVGRSRQLHPRPRRRLEHDLQPCHLGCLRAPPRASSS